MEMGDIDPSYSMLRYLCDRFELNMEQRYWLAFLYSTCYCGATVFYVYNEFPDFENVDIGRLSRWWDKHKARMLFQTDRRWVQRNDSFVSTFESYRKALLGRTQEAFFRLYRTDDPVLNYRMLYDVFKQVDGIGRFTLFIYLEAVHVVTGFPMRPDTLNLAHAAACLRGFRYAVVEEIGKSWEGKGQMAIQRQAFLQTWFDMMAEDLQRIDPRNNIWNIETSLCAYGKYREHKKGSRNARYIGYYIDRQADEITTMQTAVPDGVDWDVLWQYRRETFDNNVLKEITGHGNDKR